MITNLVSIVLKQNGSIENLAIPSEKTHGLALTNPSIFYDGKGIMTNLRYVEYALYHSENEQQFQNQWGVLAYLHPEDDMHLRTKNIFTSSLHNNDFGFIDTTALDREPKWEFVGLEDARIVVWNGKTYLCGVRRDTKTDGEGRMELSEIVDGAEISRYRIEPPNGHTYCEKNWMPIVNMPYHFVKWSNPTEVVRVNLSNGSSETVVLKQQPILAGLKRDIRGGSQVISYKGYYIAITHEVELWNNEKGNKDGQYYHRIIVWDNEWNVVKYSEDFKFLGANIEFCCGMTIKDDSFLITFGFQDTTSFLLTIPCDFVDNMLGFSDKPTNHNEPQVIAENLVNNFALQCFDENANFNLGAYFYENGHFASALSFFLRSAEYGQDEDVIYEALIMVSKCLANLGRRRESEKTALLNAISYNPKRFEAYIYLSYFYEQSQDYFNCYAMAKIADSLFMEKDLIFLPKTEKYKVEFQVGFSAWWVGKFKECRSIMFKLANDYTEGKYEDTYKQQIQANITRLGSGDEFVMYNKNDLSRYKYDFEGIDSVVKNYSQCFQDMFILTLLNGKKNGTYLEIGSADPYKGNNTYLLESSFEWMGMGLEILYDEVQKYNANRTNKCILGNALNIDYDALLEQMAKQYKTENCFDYLQIDCEPPNVSLQILKKIPFDRYKFGIITFEHDYYADIDKSIREQSRQYLESQGYVLVIGNVSMNDYCPYEDWWVHPDLVSEEKYIKILEAKKEVVNIKKHLIFEYDSFKK